MGSTREQQILEFKESLEKEKKEKLFEDYKVAEQVRENVYDSYNYFRMNIFKDLIFKDIKTKEELREAINNVRANCMYLENEFSAGFLGEITHLRDIEEIDEESMAESVKDHFKLKHNILPSMTMKEEVLYSILNKINVVDYYYFNNESLKDKIIELPERLNETLLGKKDENQEYQLEDVIYNLKYSIKLSFRIYEDF